MKNGENALKFYSACNMIQANSQYMKLKATCKEQIIECCNQIATELKEILNILGQ